MKNRTAHFVESESACLPVSELEKLARNWLLDGELSDRSPKTLKARRDTVDKLRWYLTRREEIVCGVEELRGFFLYLQRGHLDPGGRWGNPTETNPLRPLTLRTYYAYLRAFFNFAVDERRLDASPMSRIPAPRDPGDEVQPFSDQEIEKLLAAAKKTNEAKRDTAILLTLYDTGIRASELCALTFRDVDFDQRSLLIREGKGQKTRHVYLGKRATRAIYHYANVDGRDPGDPLFLSQREAGLTYSGLAMLFRRLGKKSGVKDCHPHRFRHAFAVSFLRAGGNQFSLMRLLGHTTLHVTNRYVQLAQADIAAQHKAFSPGDRLRAGR